LGRRAEPPVWKRGRGRDSIGLRIVAFAGLEQAITSDEWSCFWIVQEEVSDDIRRLSPCPLLGAEYTASPGGRSVPASPCTSLYQARKAGNFRFYSGQLLLCDKDKDVGI